MNRSALIQKLEKLSRNQKILILVGTILAISAIYWFGFFSSAYSHIQELEKDISNLEKNISKKREKLAKFPEWEGKFNKYKKEMQYAQDLLPASKVGIENLLSQIEQLGKKVGIEFISFVPGKESVKEFYAIRKVRLHLRGAFPNLMLFYNKLSSLNRLVSLESLQLKPQRSSGKTLLRIDSRIFLYRTLTPQEKKQNQNKS